MKERSQDPVNISISRTHQPDDLQIGSIKEDQIKSYAGRKGVAVEKAETWLGANLAYDNNAPAK